MPELRVWVEEHPKERLSFSWLWREESTDRSLNSELGTVIERLEGLDGIQAISPTDEGVMVSIDERTITRQELAIQIRTILGADLPVIPEPPDPETIRVWAEDLSDGSVEFSWQTPEAFGERYEPADRRAVQARLSAQKGVNSVRSTADGIRLYHNPDVIERADLAGLVRTSLSLDADLKTRADAMLRRTPAYANLARILALDERISPIPEAGRQFKIGNRGIGPSFALRMLPGYMTIRRIQMMLPVIQSLSTWSREAPPEVVDQHLETAGLSREILAEDYITSLEVKLLAREIGGEKASQAGQSAAKAATRALDFGREILEKQRNPELK